MHKLRVLLTIDASVSLDFASFSALRENAPRPRSREPDLIISEWRVIGLSGPILIQRVRSLGFLQVPIIVISSLITRNDAPILREMGVDECREKPFDRVDFFTVVISALQQNRCPTEQKSLVMKIKRLLRADKIGEAERLLAHLYLDPRISKGVKLEVEAEYYVVLEQYSKAIEIGLEALSLNGDSLEMLNLVGRAMLKLKKFSSALECFEKANNMSSSNIDRLLNISEICLTLGEIKKAETAVDSAQKLDPTNIDVRSMACKVKIETGDSAAAKRLMDNLDSSKSIVSYMNNRAVTLAKSGRFEDGITLYKKTLAAIPTTWKALTASVLYNLGLAQAKYGSLEDAQATFQLITNDQLESSPVASKVKSLMNRINEAVTQKSKLILHDQDSPTDWIDLTINSFKPPVPAASVGTTQTQDTMASLIAKLEVHKGDICCYLLYYCFGASLPETDKLLAKSPVFGEHSSISKAN